MLFRKPTSKRQYSYNPNDPTFTPITNSSGQVIVTEQEATFQTCLRIMQDTISKLSLKLHKSTENGVETDSKHYLSELLRLRPNSFQSASTFWKCVEYNRLEYGHSVVVIETYKTGKNAGQIRGLYPLDMSKVKVWVDDAGLFSDQYKNWYVYNHNGKKEVKYSQDQVLHFFGLTADGVQGISVKDYLRTIVENAKSGQRYVNNYFKNGLSAKGLLQYTGEINHNDAIAFKQKMEGMMTGLDNTGRLSVMPLGISFQPINSTMADAQFLEINQLSIQMIAAAFGVKMHMLNDLSSATHTNIAEQQKDFYVGTLQSILTMYEQELTWKLLTSKQREEGYLFEFNVDSILRADLKTRYDSYAVGINNGFMKPNEARRLERLPSEEGGDELIANGNMQKIKDIGALYKQPPPSEGGDK